MRLWMVPCLAALCALSPASFTAEETLKVLRFWSAPGRYTVGPPGSAKKTGLWQVRLTTEGSTWLLAYQRARTGGAKIPPTQTPAPVTDQDKAFEAWIDAKVASDRYQAQALAQTLNASADPLPAAPPDPGIMPPGLFDLAGNPPKFANAVVPLEHAITFDDDAIRYADNPTMRPRYAYYRFAKGVMSGGTKPEALPPGELAALFAQGKIEGPQAKVMLAISALEGGFDSVNTYDTGYVSVGFLQFATLSGGSGSLGEVLLRMKRDDPAEFEDAFRRFGLDVTDTGVLQALDLDTGAQLLGPDAAMKVIEDKRLIAVFQRAGRRNAAFRLAQLRQAIDRFYPANDEISLVLDQPVFGRVSDIVRSEAGLATLMDRKVNTGSLNGFLATVTRIAKSHGAKTLEDVAKHEREIVQAMKYRRDFLADSTLTQPPPARPPG